MDSPHLEPVCYACQDDPLGIPVGPMLRELFQLKSAVLACFALLVMAAPAHAFRCGSKIVVKDMHEAQVRRACGAPTTMRHLGTTVRGVFLPYDRVTVPGATRRYWPGYGSFTEEVVITEYVYNFGPRKLMRRLLFEGGVLVSIETLGYGYIEDQ